MFRRFGIFWVLLTLLIAGGVAAIAYHAGVTAQLPAGAVAGPPYYYGYGGWGFGWIFPLLFFFLILALVFRPRRHWGYWGYRGYGHGPEEHKELPPPIEQRLQDWHDKAHQGKSDSPSGDSA